MPELILPTTRLHAGFLECRHDWGPGLHEDGFGIGADDDVDSPTASPPGCTSESDWSTPWETPCPAEKHGSPRRIIEDGQVLGGIALSFLGAPIRVTGWPREQLRHVIGDAGFTVEDTRSYVSPAPDAPPEVQLFLIAHRA